MAFADYKRRGERAPLQGCVRLPGPSAKIPRLNIAGDLIEKIAETDFVALRFDESRGLVRIEPASSETALMLQRHPAALASYITWGGFANHFGLQDVPTGRVPAKVVRGGIEFEIPGWCDLVRTEKS